MKYIDIQDMYFGVLEILSESYPCSKRDICPLNQDCVECMSEQLVSSNKLSIELINKILGE